MEFRGDGGVERFSADDIYGKLACMNSFALKKGLRLCVVHTKECKYVCLLFFFCKKSHTQQRDYAT